MVTYQLCREIILAKITDPPISPRYDEKYLFVYILGEKPGSRWYILVFDGL
jgi:hypothetical protein